MQIRMLITAVLFACSTRNAAKPPPSASGSSVGHAQASTPCESIEPVARVAGFYAAHAIWSVSNGDTLVTMVGSETADGKRTLDRLVTDRIEDSITRGREQLRTNPRHVARAVLVYDGKAPSGDFAAIRVEARDYDANARSLDVAVPYRNAGSGSAGSGSAGNFQIDAPTVVNVAPDAKDCPSLMHAFWEGVDSHAKAAEVWNAHAVTPPGR